MPTLDEYLELAGSAYGWRNNPGVIVGDFEVTKVEHGTPFGNGFQGVVFENKKEIVVAFAGTGGNLLTAPISQNSANVRIGLGIIPNMAGAAHKFVEGEKAKGKPVSIVGHSLGGALAQVAGVWTDTPFISLNSPGMADHLRIARVNISHPRQMMRTIRSASGSDAVGICFSTKGDFVGNFGRHAGHSVRLPGRAERNHDIDAIGDGLEASRHQEPHHWDSRFRQIASEQLNHALVAEAQRPSCQPETSKRLLKQSADIPARLPIRRINMSTTSLEPSSPALPPTEGKRASRTLHPSVSQPNLLRSPTGTVNLVGRGRDGT